MPANATEGKSRFGNLCSSGNRESAFVEPADQLGAAIPSAQHKLAPRVTDENVGFAAQKNQFESEFADWITAENARVDSYGVPGADLRPW
jgi:hypothetical protein